MKLNRIAILALAVCLAVPAVVRAASPEILTVAVFNFESKDEAVRELGPQVAALISANLSTQPGILTVEREELKKVLGEQELGLSGTVSPDTAAKVGHLTGARVLVTGRVFRANGDLVIVASIIGTETSRVYGSVVTAKATASIAALSEELAKKIGDVLSRKADTLVAKVQTREELVAKIKKALEGKTLPTVSVRISERHFGQPVVDPAAETELGKILMECGFKVVNDRSPEKPQVEITGDAFSAFGLRKGNLISCEAHLELKAQKRDGDILAIDRQTSVAVDIAEQTAAKTALQNAADAMAERLLPKLGQ
jgi:Curli production assembly/transport component CsgG